ncbi:MAG TPA: hypothetical protein VH092_30185 [Urbifossiella sp.]|jgi:hypothetical protein|nr:hypothetical protein [Urbifossiella sp.]
MPPTPTDLPLPPAGEPVPPDLLAWVRQTFDAEEFLNGPYERGDAPTPAVKGGD